MRKILVLRGGALGDFIVTLPTLAWLRRRWPASRIELVGNPTATDIGRREKLLDAVHSQHEARWSALYGSAELPPEFAAWLNSFDLVLNYWPDPERELVRRFPLHANQRFLWAESLPERVPAAAHYAEPLRALGRESEKEENFYRLKNVAAESVCSSSVRIALHPGSGSPRKNWPIAKWKTLAEWLRTEKKAELLIVLGEAEKDAGVAEDFENFGQLAQGLPLTELSTKLCGCQLFLGHDSGVSHLAAACGVPCVLLFGPTDSAMWAPPAPTVHVLRKNETLASVSLADVQEAVRTALVDRR